MPSFLDNLPYYRIRVRLLVSATTPLQRFPAPNIAGAIKSAVMEQCQCDDERQIARPDCRRCEVRAECIYLNTFEPGKVAGSNVKNRRPYIVKCNSRKEDRIRRGDILEFELVLMGPAMRNYAVIVAALEHSITFGTRPENRVHFPLKSIECVPSAKMIFDGNKHCGEPLATTVISPEAKGDNLYITHAPYIYYFRSSSSTLDTENRKSDMLTNFGELIYYIHERAADLYSLYGDHSDDKKPQLDRHRADNVRIHDADLHLFHISNVSRRKPRRSKMITYYGKVKYLGKWQKWQRLIAAGEVFHIGKETSKGLGWYQYHSR